MPAEQKAFPAKQETKPLTETPQEADDDKVGYIYISIDSCRGTVGDMDCLVIDSPEELLDKLLYEMAVDIMEEGGHDLNPVEASALERAEVARRLNVYLEQLPEYQDRISFVFERK